MTELTTYQGLHLDPVYREVSGRLLPAFVTATRAHVVGLVRTGVFTPGTGVHYLDGLDLVSQRLHDAPLPDYDGTFEDAYYVLEVLLAEQLGVSRSELGIQTARSRNDLDAAVFRILLREDLLQVADGLIDLVTAVLERAEEHREAVIIGFTHRRPAQPTTIGHVLAGFAEALTEHTEAIRHQLSRLGASPLGSCAFAGTDLPLDRVFLAHALGFDELLVNSYDAVAGADVYGRQATVFAELAALTARVSRTLLDWLTAGWVLTPDEFCQGSSIMPQKRNPVVLEHLASYAGLTIADAQAVLGLIGLSWWEDSNNATTDVQSRLWATADRTRRSVLLLARLFTVFRVGELPSRDEIVHTGATTTAVADALVTAGLPFRGAHEVVGALTRRIAPDEWTVADLATALREAGADPAAAVTAIAALEPDRTLARAQADGPGQRSVAAQVSVLRERARPLSEAIAGQRERDEASARGLSNAEAAVRADTL